MMDDISASEFLVTKEEKALLHALGLIKRNSRNQALCELMTVLAVAPLNVTAHFLAAECNLRLRRYAKARAEAHAALGSDPACDVAYYLLADIALQQDKCVEGLNSIDKALSLNPGNIDYTVLRGQLLMGKGEYQQALAVADDALKRNPGHETALALRTITLINLGRRDEAAQEAKRALRRDPDDPSAWYQHGSQLLMEGHFMEARMALREALRLNPEFPEAQDALMKTIAANHFFFALFWRWMISIYRFPPDERRGIVVGIVMVVQILNVIARYNSKLAPILFIIMTPFALFFIYISIAPSLFNLAVRKGWIR